MVGWMHEGLTQRSQIDCTLPFIKHIARRPAQIAYEALEVRHLSNLFDFVHDRLL